MSIEESRLEITFQTSGNIASILFESQLSLFVTTYQAQRIFVFYAQSENVMSHLSRSAKKPTGLYVSNKEMIIAERSALWRFSALPQSETLERENQPYDVIYAPRSAFVTGDLATHEVYLSQDKCIYFVNTRLSCIAQASEQYSFIPFWKPHFISQLVVEDRCHLNGFAWQNDALRYVTALGESDVRDGWRQNRASGGIVIDVQHDQILSRGLCMPHSPRIVDDELYILESGKGALARVDRKSGEVHIVDYFPGFLRGMSIYKNYCFIGLSRARKDKIFHNLPVADQHRDLECSIICYDLKKGEIAGKIVFNSGVDELFSVECQCGMRSVSMISLTGDLVEQTISFPGKVLRKNPRKKMTHKTKGKMVHESISRP